MKKLSTKIIAVMALSALMLSCSKPSGIKDIVKAEKFDTTINEKPVKLYYLTNHKGVEMAVTNFGARVVALTVPAKEGKTVDVVLGFESIAEYVKPNATFYGPVVGRFANRVAKGQFVIGTDTFKLEQNNNGQCLHGGKTGLHNQVWTANQVSDSVLELSYLAADGEGGFPGNLTIKTTYTLTSNNEFKVDYEATTDKATVVNLSQHSFFNFNGAGDETINDLEMTINADKFTAVDSVLIPTGLVSVDGTPFDFRKATTIGARVNDANDQLKMGHGYDHNWVINRTDTTGGLNLDATIYSSKTGIMVEILSDQPGMQFYGGNFFDGNDYGKGGKKYAYRAGMALETQKFPDSPNQPSFPSTALNPGEKYTQTCVYRFSVK